MTKEFNRSFHFDVNGHSFRIQNYYDDNRSGFNHTSVLFMDGLRLGEARLHYINRTWETYAYQTSAESAISDYVSYLRDGAARRYKLNHNIGRFTKTHKDNFEREFASDDLSVSLRLAMQTLRAGQPKTVYAWEV